MSRFSGIATTVAAVLFGISVVVFGATAVDAFRTDDAPLPQPESVRPTPTPGVEEPGSPGGETGRERLGLFRTALAYPHTTEGELLEAVNQDIFQPDRTPPLERYVPPSLRPSTQEPQRDNRRRSEPDLRIVGTAIAGGVALAMVLPDDSLPFSVMQGEYVDGYLLAAVGEEMVTLVRGEEEFFLPVVEARTARDSDNRRGQDGDRAAAEDMYRALGERIRQLQQLNTRGQGMRGGMVPMASDRPMPTAIEVPVMIRTRPGGGSGGGALRPDGGGSRPDDGVLGPGDSASRPGGDAPEPGGRNEGESP